MRFCWDFGGILLAAKIRGSISDLGQEDKLMKKSELSEAASNLLIFGSVSLAFAPFVLGDRLILIVTGLMKDGGVMLDQFSNYVSWLLS